MFKKRLLALLTAACLVVTFFSAIAENGGVQPANGGEPPQAPQGEIGEPPEGFSGEAPDGMGDPPEGMEFSGGAPNGIGGMPEGGMHGGMSSQPESYAAANAFSEDAELTGVVIESTGADENAVLVTAGTFAVSESTVTRVSADSTGGDNASFYGVGAAMLVTGGTLTVSDSTITTDASGGAGVFAYGDGTAYVYDAAISTTQDASGGIHVAGGGTLYAQNLTVTTEGGSAAAIRSDRGSGTMVVDGGSYTSNGSGSPAVYVTADITIQDALLSATGSEGLCLEGLNSVRLYNCELSGNMPDLVQNDNTWTVILYQSMSGDSEIGEGYFEMDGGTLLSQNGGLFYTTNTESEFVLRGVTITAAQDSEYFLRCTGNANQRGWGTTGANGADCTFTAISQEMLGSVIWDSISNLDLYLTEGSVLNGAVLNDESCAGAGGDGSCAVTIDETSSWIVTGNSVVTTLNAAGTIRDENGDAVSIIGMDGAVYVEGTSEHTITVTTYSTGANLEGAGTVSSFAEHSGL